MKTQGKVKFQVWLMIFLVFILGGVTGASIDHLYNTKYGSSRSGPPPGSRRQAMIENMRRDLNLSEDQVKQVRQVFEETRKESQRRSAVECPVFNEMREKTRQNIRAVLNPEQQQKYDAINAKHDAERSNQKNAR
ncbi:MAG: hypothetical protein IPM55_04200 [Acidobacteria bacterium]|nr:hypothetical protein [Acidobacteriota bacterium]